MWSKHPPLSFLDLFISALSDTVDHHSPVSRMRRYISSLPTQTAIPSAIQTLTRMLLLHTALSTGSSHLLLGTSLTSLSISLISSISQGGGFAVREEAQEEWTPKISANSQQAKGYKNETIRVIRPLRDIGMKECAIWAWWGGLTVVGRERFPNGKQSIGALTRGEIQSSLPNNCHLIPFFDRLRGRVGTGLSFHGVHNCPDVCQIITEKRNQQHLRALRAVTSSLVAQVASLMSFSSPAQSCIQDWKAQISVRSLKTPSHSSLRSTEPLSAASLTPSLCYTCHTTLTSRSSRGTTATGYDSLENSSVPLPTWVLSNIRTTLELTEDGERWSRTKMSADQMTTTFADCLLEE